MWERDGLRRRSSFYDNVKIFMPGLYKAAVGIG